MWQQVWTGMQPAVNHSRQSPSVSSLQRSDIMLTHQTFICHSLKVKSCSVITLGDGTASSRTSLPANASIFNGTKQFDCSGTVKLSITTYWPCFSTGNFPGTAFLPQILSSSFGSFHQKTCQIFKGKTRWCGTSSVSLCVPAPPLLICRWRSAGGWARHHSSAHTVITQLKKPQGNALQRVKGGWSRYVIL